MLDTMIYMKYLRFCRPIYLIIALSVTLTYLPSFSGGFLHDDHFLIRTNHLIQSPPSLGAYLFQEDGIIPGRSWENSHTGYYRPLVYFVHRMDYLLWGMNPRGFRLTNIVLHLFTCLMLFKVLCFLIKESTAPFWATCIFALHPVNTEAVSWISSRNNILAALFALSCLYCFFKYCEDRKYPRLILTFLFFTLSVFSKEFGLVLLPILMFYQFFFERKKGNVLNKLAVYLPMIFIVLGYFLLRKAATGNWVAPSGAADLFQRLYFVPYLLIWNIRLILFPFGLHNFIVQYPVDYFSGLILISVICIGIIILMAWKSRGDGLSGFAILSFFASLLPILNIFRTSSVTLVSMRWLYFPMIFATFLFAGWAHRFLQLKYSLSRAILAIITIYMGTYSFMLNKYLWHDESAFYSFEIHQFRNEYYYGGLAENLFSRGDLVGAENYFKKAIETRPRAARNYINYAALMLESNRATAALETLKRAENLIMTKRERGEWYNNLGNAYFNLGKYTQAIGHMKEAITLNPNEPYLWGNLGVGYAKTGDYTKSINSIKKGLERFPDSIDLKKKLSIVYIRMEAFEAALSIIESIPKEKWHAYGIDQLHNDTREKLKSE